jgi:4-hydroxybenzoate polyprenyltransferase
MSINSMPWALSISAHCSGFWFEVGREGVRIKAFVPKRDLMNLPWNAYWRLMRFDRPIGILLLLWPTWWALLLAGEGRPSLKNALIFTAGVVLMRAAGCVMNDIADRDFDPHVERTRCRPLAAGEVSTGEAVGLFLALMALAFALVLMTNVLTIKLAFAGAVLAATYPFFKRFTHVPQVVLGIAFGWGIPMAFAAEANAIPPVAWWLLGINTLWSVIYDTLYAMVDREDDLEVGVKSTAILFGRYDVTIIAVLMVLMILLLAWLGLTLGLGWPWFAGVAVAAVLFGRQIASVRGRDREACFRAFLNNNWVGFSLFLGLALQYLLPA